jgi:uncharacterized protein (TIGR02466 family)
MAAEEEKDAPAVMHQLFPTNVLSKDWGPDVAERIKHVILGHKASNPEGIYRSNAAGTWHSNDQLLMWSGDVGKELQTMFKGMFIAAFEQMAIKKGGKYTLRLAAWAMVYSDQGYATVHTHPNCHMSSVYYVDPGPQDTELTMATGVRVVPGNIEFLDTRGCGNMTVPGLTFQPAARIAPKLGKMLIFPSWLPHFVHPVRGTEPRISIACNCTLLKYTPPTED